MPASLLSICFGSMFDSLSHLFSIYCAPFAEPTSGFASPHIGNTQLSCENEKPGNQPCRKLQCGMTSVAFKYSEAFRGAPIDGSVAQNGILPRETLVGIEVISVPQDLEWLRYILAFPRVVSLQTKPPSVFKQADVD
jgi:hypothetical protein